MQDEDIKRYLAEGERRAVGNAPDFAATWSAAERRLAARPSKRWLGGAAAVAALALLAVALQPTVTNEPPGLIDRQALTASTRWVAPSDALLPKRRFDIFSDLPVLMESTGTDEGALL